MLLCHGPGIAQPSLFAIDRLCQVFEPRTEFVRLDRANVLRAPCRILSRSFCGSNFFFIERLV